MNSSTPDSKHQTPNLTYPVKDANLSFPEASRIIFWTWSPRELWIRRRMGQWYFELVILAVLSEVMSRPRGKELKRHISCAVVARDVALRDQRAVNNPMNLLQASHPLTTRAQIRQWVIFRSVTSWNSIGCMAKPQLTSWRQPWKLRFLSLLFFDDKAPSLTSASFYRWV